jgi:GMP synthase-like glutamine amidotransferase
VILDAETFSPKNEGMKALILRHTLSTPAGTTLVWLDNHKFSYQELMVKDIQIWPDLQSFDWLIICGGAMNVDQEETYPWLKQEKKFISSAIAAGKKIVGLCLGSQLLAEILGAKVYRHSQWETGWHSVQLQSGTEVKVFEWHAYTFDLPPQAELLATNSQCRNQAYKVGSQILAFQFHPEADQDWVLERASDPEAPAGGFTQSPTEIKNGIDLYLAKLQIWYFAELDQHLRL